MTNEDVVAVIQAGVAGCMGEPWEQVDTSELQTMIASNFMRDYRAIIAQKKDFAKIPKAVKQLAETPATYLIEG